MDFEVFDGGVLVQGARVLFRINGGNIIQFGTELVGDVRVSARPTVSGDEAVSLALAWAGVGAGAAEVLQAGKLKIYPELTAGEVPGESYRGGAGAGHAHRLVREVDFRLAGDHRTYRAVVDAGSGTVLELYDTNQYTIATVNGGVYPNTNTYMAPFSSGGAKTIARPSTVTNASGLGCNRYACPNSYAGPMGYEGHCESYIASTAVWDLTKLLVASICSADAGYALMPQLWYGSLFPTKSAYQVVSGGQCNPSATVNGCGASNWYTVLLAVDDDDGNLANGTPNGCRIWQAFNDHRVACGTQPLCSQTRYTFTTLDVPGGTATSASGINDAGQIVGSFISGGPHGFLKDGSTYTTLVVPGSTMTWALGNNNAGQIVGSFSDSSGRTHGFLKDGSTYTTLDVPGSVWTLAYGINGTDQIVGYFTDSGGAAHGFIAVP